MAVSVSFLPEGELVQPLIRQIRRATQSVDMAYFYWKTLYAQYGIPSDVVQAALDAAKKEGVHVRVLLGYGSDVPSIQYLNYLTARELEAGGVEVRLAPTNRTTHLKMTVVDRLITFVGSHNITNGALSGDNAEVTLRVTDNITGNRAGEYYESLWQQAVSPSQIAPPPPPETPDEGVSGYFPPPLAPLLTATADPQSGAAALEWTAVPAAYFARYELHKNTQPGVTEESPLVISIPSPGLTRYVDATRNPAVPTYYRLYLYNTAGVCDGSAEVLLPPDVVPQINLTGVANENNALVCSFTVDSREGITAIAALSSPNADLSNATKGPEFDHTVSQAWVVPVANAGETVYVAVAAYADSVGIARSNILSIVYEPVTPPPPPAITPPVVVSVMQIGPMGINVEYSHVTPADFARYEVQQRTNETWNTLATITTPETRSWSGGPVPYMDPTHPVRVVVFVQSGDSAASDEMAITPM